MSFLLFCSDLRVQLRKTTVSALLTLCIPVAAAAAKSLQSCPTLCDPIDCIPRGDRDLGLAYQTHPGNQASSRREAKNSAVLLSRDGCLLEPTVYPKGSQASCGVWIEDSGFLSRPCRKRRPSSRDDGGLLWVF